MNPIHVGRIKEGTLSYLSDFKGPLLIFGAALYFYFLAGKMDEATPPGHLGPAFWPKAILILLMVSCGIKAVEIFFSRKKESEAKGDSPPLAVNYPRLLALIAVVVGAVAAMDLIGFLLANLIFLLLFMHIAGVKKKFPLFLISGLGTLFLLYLFVKVVYLPLPKGYWFFNDLTIFLYRVLQII
jgi:putative tricarboxylic transport membrane protein